MLLEEPGEDLTGELAALVGVEDIRSALPERFLQGLDAEISIQSAGKPPEEYVAGVPVDNGHKV